MEVKNKKSLAVREKILCGKYMHYWRRAGWSLQVGRLQNKLSMSCYSSDIHLNTTSSKTLTDCWLPVVKVALEICTDTPAGVVFSGGANVSDSKCGEKPLQVLLYRRSLHRLRTIIVGHGEALQRLVTSRAFFSAGL